MSFFRRTLCLLLLTAALLTILPASARGVEEAVEISGMECVAEHTGFEGLEALFNDYTLDPTEFPDHSSLTLAHEEGIGSLYFIFQDAYFGMTITDNDTGTAVTWEGKGFLHDYIDLTALFGTAPGSVTLAFDNGPLLMNELYVFTPGQVPEFVQKWDLPADGCADMVLFSTHGDDEQLFFGGILPYYEGELGMKVQVVYMTDHKNSSEVRCHEMLNGLYAVGVRTYPVFGPFEDKFSDSKALAYWRLEQAGVTPEMMTEFVVENLRRFKPLVAVTHDIKGEYGHGHHMVYAEQLMKAVELSMDPEQFPESAERYGTWDVPKTYLHLYKENPIVLDWDQPLERFDGMTAFEVSKNLGFKCHESQYMSFAWYTTQSRTAAGCYQYSPCKYGLYRTTVGEDVEKNDFFENLADFQRPQPEPEEVPTEPATEPVTEPPTEPAAEPTAPPTEAPAATQPPEEAPETPNAPLPVIPVTVGILAVSVLLAVLLWKKK